MTKFFTAAALAILCATPAAFAGDGLARFMSEPTAYKVDIKHAPGRVTYATMRGDTLAVSFVVPGHAGDLTGGVVGQMSGDILVGEAHMTLQNGTMQIRPVTMVFGADGIVPATLDGADTPTGGFYAPH